MQKLDELMTELQASGYSICDRDSMDALVNIVRYQINYNSDCGFMAMANPNTNRYVVIVTDKSNGRVRAYHYMNSSGDITFTVNGKRQSEDDLGYWSQTFEKDKAKDDRLLSICIGGVACDTAEEVAKIMRHMYYDDFYAVQPKEHRPQTFIRPYGNKTGISHKNLKRHNKSMTKR